MFSSNVDTFCFSLTLELLISVLIKMILWLSILSRPIDQVEQAFFIVSSRRTSVTPENHNIQTDKDIERRSELKSYLLKYAVPSLLPFLAGSIKCSFKNVLMYRGQFQRSWLLRMNEIFIV
jgi:hypothetical protein